MKEKRRKGRKQKRRESLFTKTGKRSERTDQQCLCRSIFEDTVIGSALANEVDIQLGRRPPTRLQLVGASIP